MTQVDSGGGTTCNAEGTYGVKSIEIQEKPTATKDPSSIKVNGKENEEAHKMQRKIDLLRGNDNTQTWANIVTGNKLA